MSGHLSVDTVLVRVSIAVMEHHDKKETEEEKIYLAYISTYSQSLKEARTGSRQGRNLEAVNWCRGHGGVQLTGLLPMACSA